MYNNDEMKKKISQLEKMLEEKEKELKAARGFSADGERNSNFSDIKSSVIFRDEVDRQTKNFKIVTEQATLANKKKSEFLERMSHDLLTPMNGMLGMISLVLETELTDKQKKYLEMVSSSAERLMEVVNDILDFSKIEVGKLDFETKEFNLREVIEFELYPQQLVADSRDIALNFSFERGVPIRVEGDVERLMQVVSNLLSTTIYSLSCGRINLDMSSRGFDSNGMFWVCFAVQSTGEIVNDNTRRDLLKSFKSGVIPAPSETGSSKMGLMIAGHLVRLAGGEVGIENDETGSRVWFTWPLAVSGEAELSIKGLKPATRSYSSMVAPPLEGEIVLVAEDDPTNRVLVEAVLSLAGAEVVSVVDGEDAYTEFLKGKYRLILMDVQMPGVDGLEAARRIREYEKKRGGHVIIIALTALALQGDREKCLAAGMDGYIAKPINKRQLINVITGYLSRSIMVVGQKQTHQNLIDTLNNNGWLVTLVQTNREAVAEASVKTFNLVFIDFTTHTESFGSLKGIAQLAGNSPRFIGIVPDEQNRERLLSSTKVDDVILNNIDEQQLMDLVENQDDE